jgi:hypothetical protein
MQRALCSINIDMQMHPRDDPLERKTYFEIEVKNYLMVRKKLPETV